MPEVALAKKRTSLYVCLVFLYEMGQWWDYAMLVVVTLGLIACNEISRRTKWGGVAFFIVLPVVLAVAVWPLTRVPGSGVEGWFPIVKTYSALAGCLGFMALRYIPALRTKAWALAFPPFILALNIAEAVYRDFECYSFTGTDPVTGLWTLGGPWNIMNGIAGIINIITITGWTGIVISKRKSQDMIWPDQLWFWIIAYDLWNFAYVYNCLADHSWYCGVALLASCTLAAFYIKKGAWLQHRAHTLAMWGMFVLTFPAFADSSPFAHASSHSTTALFTVSFVALVANIAVLVYWVKRIVVTRRAPVKGIELFENSPKFVEVLEIEVQQSDQDVIAERLSKQDLRLAT